MARTKDLRNGSDLLVLYVKPHQAVSRWLCAAIRQAGIDVSFKGHSTRAAATSQAVDSGIPLEIVLDAADW